MTPTTSVASTPRPHTPLAAIAARIGRSAVAVTAAAALLAVTGCAEDSAGGRESNAPGATGTVERPAPTIIGAVRTGDTVAVRYDIPEDALRLPGRPWHVLVSIDDPFDDYTPMTVRGPVTAERVIRVPAGLGRPTQVALYLEAANGARGDGAYGVIE